MKKMLIGFVIGAVVFIPLAAGAASSFTKKQTKDKFTTIAVGVVSDGHLNNFTTTTYTNILTETISVPTSAGDGVLHINANLCAGDGPDAGSGQLLYRLTVDGTPVTSTDVSYFLDFDDDAVTDAGKCGGAGAVVDVAPGTHTIALQAREFMGAGTLVRARDLSAVFYSTGDGVGPLPV